MRGKHRAPERSLLGTKPRARLALRPLPRICTFDQLGMSGASGSRLPSEPHLEGEVGVS